MNMPDPIVREYREWIEEVLARRRVEAENAIAEYKDAILDCLQSPNAQWPKDMSREQAWEWIVVLSQQHPKDGPRLPAVYDWLFDEIQGIERNLQKTLAKLDGLRGRVSQEQKASIAEDLASMGIPSLLDQPARDALANLAAMSTKFQDLKWNSPNRKMGDSLPIECICDLAFIYLRATTKKLTISRDRKSLSKFVDFVENFSEATGRKRKRETIAADLLTARKKKPSAFKD